MADDQQKPPTGKKEICATCYGARKVFGVAMVDGRSRTVWLTCPTCNGPSEITTGP